MARRALAALGLALSASVALAGGESPEDFDRRITAELERRSPTAAEFFRQADKARDAGDSREAADLYGSVHRLVPDFVAGDDDGVEAWSLFADREALERAMTTVIRDGVRAGHGVEIPAAA